MYLVYTTLLPRNVPLVKAELSKFRKNKCTKHSKKLTIAYQATTRATTQATTRATTQAK